MRSCCRTLARRKTTHLLLVISVMYHWSPIGAKFPVVSNAMVRDSKIRVRRTGYILITVPCVHSLSLHVQKQLTEMSLKGESCLRPERQSFHNPCTPAYWHSYRQSPTYHESRDPGRCRTMNGIASPISHGKDRSAYSLHVVKT